MRQLHIFEQEDDARTLADAMYAESIETTVKPARDGGHALWVHDDDDLEVAQEMLATFRVAPDDPRFAQKVREARARRRAEEREEKELRKRTERVKRDLDARQGTGLVTKFLILACVGFAVMGAVAEQSGAGAAVFRTLAFFDWESGEHPLAPLFRGQVWRLFTPMFIYFGLPSFGAVLHLVFDMWWLHTLAAPVEMVNRGRFLAVFVASAALVTGLAQVFSGQPFFGGMAGVVAALFAYVWARGKSDPTSPIALPPNLAFWMLLWTILAFVQGRYVPLRIAGFVFGGLVGYLHGSLRIRRR